LLRQSLDIVEDRVLRGGQGARGEEKDGKHRSGIPSRKRGGRRYPQRTESKKRKKKNTKLERKDGPKRKKKRPDEKVKRKRGGG
jgi:hypothetical protein